METYLDKLDGSWLDVKEVIAFGLGRTGEKLFSYLQDFLGLKVSLIIDNSSSVLNRGTYKGVKIVSLKDVEEEILKKNKIVILAGGMAYASIANSLKQRNLREDYDFCNIEQLVPEYSWKKNKKVALCQVGTSVTTACTLKCKDCCMFTTKVKKYTTYNLSELKEDADVFFKVVDYVLCYQILGGEAFIHKELKDYIIYLGEKYSEQIGHIQILTNATIIPDEETLKVLKKYNILVRISDYSENVPYKEQVKKFEEIMFQNNIQYMTLKQMMWSDIGFPEKHLDFGNTDEDIHKHMITCSRNCQQLNDKSYYFCGTFWAAVRGELYEQKEGEYLDLESINVEVEEDRKKILEYSLGNLPGKKYMNMCKECNGFGEDNTTLIDAGVQLYLK